MWQSPGAWQAFSCGNNAGYATSEFFFRVVTDVYPPVCGLNDATCESQRTMPLTYTATQRICFDSHPDSLTTPAPLVLITIITLRTGFPPAPSHGTRMCFVLLTQMLGAGTPAHDFVTPLTFSHSGCHTTRSSLAFLSSLPFVSTRNKVLQVRDTNYAAALLAALAGGGDTQKKRAGSGSDRGRPDVFLWTATWKFDRKLRLCLAAVCSCWRDEIIQAASPLPLSPSPSLFCPGVSREGLAGGKANVAVATVLTCSEWMVRGETKKSHSASSDPRLKSTQFIQ